MISSTGTVYMVWIHPSRDEPYIHYEVTAEISYPFPNFNGVNEIIYPFPNLCLEMDKWFHPIFHSACDHLSMRALIHFY